jgi:hypothetical protein
LKSNESVNVGAGEVAIVPSLAVVANTDAVDITLFSIVFDAFNADLFDDVIILIEVSFLNSTLSPLNLMSELRELELRESLLRHLYVILGGSQ